MVTLYSCFSIILGMIEKTTKFYEGFQSTKQKQLEDEIRANEPLETRYKVIAFIFPKIYLLFIPNRVLDEAYVRKSRELSLWHWYGVAFYVGIILLIVLMESL